MVDARGSGKGKGFIGSCCLIGWSFPIPHLGIYPDKTVIQKDTCTSMFIAALFTIAKTWEQPKCQLTGEWIRKMW